MVLDVASGLGCCGFARISGPGAGGERTVILI